MDILGRPGGFLGPHGAVLELLGAYGRRTWEMTYDGDRPGAPESPKTVPPLAHACNSEGGWRILFEMVLCSFVGAKGHSLAKSWTNLAMPQQQCACA